MGYTDSGYVKFIDAKHKEDDFRITERGIEISQGTFDSVRSVFITHEQLYQIYRTAQDHDEEATT